MTEIMNMPFCLGAMETPCNPNGLPSVHPFRLEVNHRLARLEQVDDPYLAKLLDQAYAVGAEMGTPSDSTDLGKPYVVDFVGFIDKFSVPGGDLLEIGAGTGYLSKILMDAGWHLTAIEPGCGYADSWKRHGVSVINDFFPSKKIVGAFDVIVLYTVLEHIKDTRSFLERVKKHLKPTGQLFVGVPDCTLELSLGDPSVLFHEHYQYFTSASLTNTLREVGLTCQIERSSYGRSLFAVASVSTEDLQSVILDTSEMKVMQKYLQRIITVKESINAKLHELSFHGSVGIYCPGRIINCLEPENNYRFYDDSCSLHGKYYVPFRSKILSRQHLMLDEPDTIFIASRTFGDVIKQELINIGISSDIITIQEIIK